MLPALCSNWIGEVLGAPVPEEREAACDRCVMRPPAGTPPVQGGVYFTEGKCCTYHPRLHSFLVGGVLSDPRPGSSHARAVLDRLILTRGGVSPLGVLGTRSYRKLYDMSVGFGRSTRLRCPFFEEHSGGCGIWRHRESTCATWYCKHDRGAVGEAFWAAARDLLQHLELSISQWCALELNTSSETLAASLAEEATDPDPEDLDGSMSQACYHELWGTWSGREHEYYRACARLVDGLAWPDVYALGGATARVLTRLVRVRFQALCSREAPAPRLRVGRHEVVSIEDGSARIHTYRRYDPLDVPVSLLAALARFDGRPTPEVVQQIADCDGLAISESLLATLTDFEVLVAEGSTRSTIPPSERKDA
jgi:hypothetical protein